jgi:hypothetical protein
MTTPETFADLRGTLPEHHAEVMTAHEGRPTLAVQDATHTPGLPEEDRGMTDQEKYGGMGAVSAA